MTAPVFGHAFTELHGRLGFPVRRRVVHAGPMYKAAMARPTGVGHALATYRIPIEGRDEWLAVARRLA